jgi:hypothetical protein
MYAPFPAVSSVAGKTAFAAAGPSASASNSVNHSDAVGSARGRLWTVCRIHTPRPPSGRVALM